MDSIEINRNGSVQLCSLLHEHGVVDMVENEDYIAIRSDSLDTLYSYVMIKRNIDKDRTEEVLTKLREFYRGKKFEVRSDDKALLLHSEAKLMRTFFSMSIELPNFTDFELPLNVTVVKVNRENQHTSDIVSVMHQSWGDSLEGWKELYNKLSKCESLDFYIIYANDMPVGSRMMLQLKDTPNTLQGWKGAIIPSERKKGYGTVLLKYVLQQASKEGFKLFVNYATHGAPVSAWKSIGMNPGPSIQYYYEV